jgi:hypothetical protein
MIARRQRRHRNQAIFRIPPDRSRGGRFRKDPAFRENGTLTARRKGSELPVEFSGLASPSPSKEGGQLGNAVLLGLQRRKYGTIRCETIDAGRHRVLKSGKTV